MTSISGDVVETKLLAGDTALITGAASGIGRAIGEALIREGARVFLTDIDGSREKAAMATLAESGAQCCFLTADLADPGAAGRIADTAIGQFGGLSILVHCASARHRNEPVLGVAEDAWDEMLGVDLRAGYRLARHIGTHMRDRGIKGRMVFITSLHARTPRNVPHYSAAKAGLTMLMKEMAKALGPNGIRVNAIAPGLVSPNWYAGAEPIVRVTPLRRLGKPDEVAGMTVALLADRFSAFVTGTVVAVDGGLSLHNWLPEEG